MNDTGPDATPPREFVDTDLRGARFVRADLSGAVMRGVDVQGADIDAPWLLEEGGSLLVNGVDVVAHVEAELDRRFPGHAQRRAETPRRSVPRGPRSSSPGPPRWRASRRCASPRPRWST